MEMNLCSPKQGSLVACYTVLSSLKKGFVDNSAVFGIGALPVPVAVWVFLVGQMYMRCPYLPHWKHLPLPFTFVWVHPPITGILGWKGGYSHPVGSLLMSLWVDLLIVAYGLQASQCLKLGNNHQPVQWLVQVSPVSFL